MSIATVSVIIVTYKAHQYLEDCVESLIRQIQRDIEIILISNDPNQNICSKIAARYTNVKLIINDKNLFYTDALNKGIEVSSGEFVLCMNDDAFLDEAYVEEALRVFHNMKNIGMVQGKILRHDRATIDSTGLQLTLWRTAKERGYNKLYKGQYEKEGYVFGVTGAVAFYRREMLEDIKIEQEYFDSDFRMFYEDLDIAWRANNLGWRAYYWPKAIAYHIRGLSARTIEGINSNIARRYISEELHYDLFKNRYLSLVKNESIFDFIFHLPFILFYDFFVWVYFVLLKRAMIKKIFTTQIPFKSAFRKRRLLKMKLIAYKS